MPTDLSTSMTFREGIKRLAERVGLADYGAGGGEAAGIPSNDADLDKVKRYLNAGYRLFQTSNPKWTFARIPVTLVLDSTGQGPMNIDGDQGRYQLPGYCRHAPVTNWRYIGANIGLTEIITIDHVLVERYREATGNSLSQGYPRWAGHRRIPSGGPMGSDRRAWELLLWPKPRSNFTIRAEFRVLGHQLVDLDERHIAGDEHDEAILAAAQYEWAKDDEEMSARLDQLRAKWQESLAASVRIDREDTPRRLGQLRDTTLPSEMPQGRLPRVMSYNGVPIPGTTPIPAT